MEDDSNLFARAKTQLILHHPFFGVLVMHLQTVAVPPEWFAMASIKLKREIFPTASVDGEYIHYNAEWVRTLTEEQRIGLLAHEVVHPAHGHLWRRGARDKETWDVACDLVTNQILLDAGLKLPPIGLFNDNVRGMSVEAVYEELNLPEGKEKEGKRQRRICGMESSGEMKVRDGHLENPLGEGEGDPPQGSGAQTETDGTPRREQLQQEWMSRLIQAAMVAKMQGKLPANLERLVQQLTTPKVSWQQVLERFCNDAIRDDYDMQRQDRRFIQQGIFFPELLAEGAKIAVAVDTSGSIEEDVLQDFVSEVVGISRCRCVKGVRVMACDAAVTLDEMIRPWDGIPDSFPGQGGTDFRPVFERIEEDGEKPAVLVYLTDGRGTFPTQEPGYPVLWVITRRPYEDELSLPRPTCGATVVYELEK